MLNVTYARAEDKNGHPVEVKLIINTDGSVVVTEINGETPHIMQDTGLTEWLKEIIDSSEKEFIAAIPVDATVVNYEGSSCHSFVSGGTTYWRCHSH